MTRKKFRFYMLMFTMISTLILSGFIINHNNQKSSEGLIRQPEIVQNESMSDGSSNSALWAEQLEFFVNEGAVKKTKTTINEVTTFVIETKLFITNKSLKTVNIDPDAFKITYDTEGAGLLFSTEYGNIEKPVVLEAYETTAINFVVKYVIQDAEKFNDFKKRVLKFDYIDKQVLVCLV